MNIQSLEVAPMSPTLTEDIIYSEILPRLPAKSLLRFKCVCKSFEKLISSAEFINLHLRQSVSSYTNRLLILKKFYYPYSLYIYNLDSPKSSHIELGYPEIPTHQTYGDFNLVGSCNGLLCVIKTYDDYGHDRFFDCILLNPSTRSCTEFTFDYHDLPDKSRYPLKFGFGFDNIKDDYKLISVAKYYPDRDFEAFDEDDNVVPDDDMDGYEDIDDAVKVVVQVMVYSLKEKSYRGLVDERVFYCKQCEFHCRPATINNHLLHWLLRGKDMICCFDISSEQWADDVLLPDNYLDNSIHIASLGVLDGCLLIVTRGEFEVNVWGMKEYKVEESWVKLFRFSLDDAGYSLVSPLAYTDRQRNEVLVFDQNGKCFRYNIKSKTRIKVEFVAAAGSHHAHICEGSLVTIPGCNVYGKTVKL